MGSMANLKLSFSMVTVPVALQKADNERSKTSRNQLHKHADGTFSPVGTRQYCKDEECDKHDLISGEEVTKGVLVSKGTYVEFTDEEYNNLKTPSSGMIAVEEVVSRQAFTSQPLLNTGSCYYLVPPNTGSDRDAYATMLTALGTDVAIGKVSMYGRTQHVAVMVEGACFLMFGLRYPEEIRETPQFSLPEANKKYVAIGKQILATFKADEISLEYADDLGKAFKAKVAEKATGVVFVDTEEPAAPTVAIKDFGDILKAALNSLEGGKGKKAGKKKGRAA